jgi:predicted negative regulator of RcsB-dependent stress response
MTKFKLVMLLILIAVLVDFALENGQAVPELKLFKQHLGTTSTFILAYISLAVGLIVGWSAFGLRVRKKRRGQAVQAASAQQSQEPQAGQTDSQGQ